MEIIRPIEKDGIEFYVSNDGKTSGMSIRGLARFIGMAPSTLRDLLQKLQKEVNEKTLSETLEALRNNVFMRTGENCAFENNAKPINSIACEAIIFYYAFESEGVSEEVKQNARKVYRKFCTYGIHQFIKDVTGFIESKNELMLMNTMQLVLEKLESLESISKEYTAIREKTSSFFPGMNQVLNDLKNDEELANMLLTPSEDGSISLEGWLDSKGVRLNKSQFHKLATLVAQTYKSMAQKEPEKAKYKVDGKTKYNVFVYPRESFPILTVCLTHLLSEL